MKNLALMTYISVGCPSNPVLDFLSVSCPWDINMNYLGMLPLNLLGEPVGHHPI